VLRASTCSAKRIPILPERVASSDEVWRSDLVVLDEVLVADKFLFSNGGAEAVLFQERVFLTNTGTEVIDFAMQHDGISSGRTRRILCFARIIGAVAVSPRQD